MSAVGGYVTTVEPTTYAANEERQLNQDLRGRLRTTNAPAIDSVAISVGGGDQTLTVASRFIYVGGNGNLVCRLAGASADTTFTGLVAGNAYLFAVKIIRQTGTTITNSLALL